MWLSCSVGLQILWHLLNTWYTKRPHEGSVVQIKSDCTVTLTLCICCWQGWINSSSVVCSGISNLRKWIFLCTLSIFVTKPSCVTDEVLTVVVTYKTYLIMTRCRQNVCTRLKFSPVVPYSQVKCTKIWLSRIQTNVNAAEFTGAEGLVPWPDVNPPRFFFVFYCHAYVYFYGLFSNLCLFKYERYNKIFFWC